MNFLGGQLQSPDKYLETFKNFGKGLEMNRINRNELLKSLVR